MLYTLTDFIDALEETYLKTSEKEAAIFQSPLFYNWKLDERNLFTRVTALMRSVLMMGALIPLNINPMSVFSYSAQLCIKGDFIHPRYQMDDIIALIRWMGTVGKRIRIVLVPVPTVSGPTSGRTFEDEMHEWYLQSKRWTIGAGEVFHFYAIKFRRMPLSAAIIWGCTFVLFYGVLLCGSHLYGIVFCSSYTFHLHRDAVPKQLETLVRFATMIITPGVIYMNSLVMFLIDAAVTKRCLGSSLTTENISFLRNVFHFLFSPLVIIAYSITELYSFHLLAVRGKSVCKHRPSEKMSL